MAPALLLASAATSVLPGLVEPWGAVIAALPFLLFTRIAPSDVLANANRSLVHAALAAAPGSSVAELARATGLSRIVVQHHLRMLSACKLVLAAERERGASYYVAGALATRQEAHILALLRDSSRLRIVSALEAWPEGLTQRDLVERTGLSQRLVSHHASRLEAAGALRRVGANPCRYVRADALVRLTPAGSSAGGRTAAGT